MPAKIWSWGVRWLISLFINLRAKRGGSLFEGRWYGTWSKGSPPFAVLAAELVSNLGIFGRNLVWGEILPSPTLWRGLFFDAAVWASAASRYTTGSGFAKQKLPRSGRARRLTPTGTTLNIPWSGKARRVTPTGTTSCTRRSCPWVPITWLFYGNHMHGSIFLG